MKVGVYKIYFTNDAKNKVYIGISNNLTRRKRDHLNNLIENCHKNKFLQNAFVKYGKENFVFEILELCSSDLLKEKERKYIEKFNTFNNQYGYNLTTGGEHCKLSESTKKKLSIVKSGRKLSDKTKIKLAVHNLLKNRPELKVEIIDGKIYVEGKEYAKSKNGKFRTPKDDEEYIKYKEDIKKKRSELWKKIGSNRIKSQQEREKLRKANIGKKASEETRKKIGSYHIGKEITTEHRERIKDKLGHKVILVDKNGRETQFKSKRECSKFLNLSASSLHLHDSIEKSINGYYLKKVITCVSAKFL
jgi:group I intron endonuclease